MGIEEIVTPGPIQDKYVIEQVIGKGGFSVVRKGYDKETKKKVAIKYVLKGVRGVMMWWCVGQCAPFSRSHQHSHARRSRREPSIMC